jgi:hypothetical protein
VWPSVFLLVCLFLLALIKGRGFNRVVRIVQSTFSSQILQQMEREEVGSLKSYALGLNIFFILNLSFLIYKLNVFYPYVLTNSPDFFQFSFFLVLTTFLVGAKALFNKLLAFFTNERKLFTDYNTNSNLVNQTFGLFLFPWIVLLEFTDFSPFIFISAAVLVLAAAILLKWYRGVIMGLVEERVGLLQIFSYFCGLEILPLFVVVKFVIETF